MGFAHASGREPSLSSTTHDPVSPSRSRLTTEGKAVGTARRLSRSKSRGLKKGDVLTKRLPEATCSDDFLPSFVNNNNTKIMADLAPLHSPPINRTDSSNISIVGLTVGSPSQLRHPNLPPPRQSPLQEIVADLARAPTPQTNDLTGKKKGDRWQKLGALFKARNAFLHDPVLSPKHRLSDLDSGQSSEQPSVTVNVIPLEPQSRYHDAKNLFDKILGAHGQLDTSSHNQRQDAGQIQIPTEAPISLLDVNIPNVHLDRYSVMFGSLLQKEDPPNLLVRRGKISDELMSNSDGRKEYHGAGNTQKEQAFTINTAKASVESESRFVYPRRATSPTSSSRSPAFSLFPLTHQPSEIRSAELIPTRHQSPRPRSSTAPGGLSPSRRTDDLAEKVDSRHPETYGNSASQDHPSKRTLVSPHHYQPTNPMFSNLPVGNDQAAPMAEAGTKIAVLKPLPVPIRQTTVTDTTTTPTKGHLDVDKATLAALERPRSPALRTRPLGPALTPSKAQVDQIMGGNPRTALRLPNSEASDKESVGKGEVYGAIPSSNPTATDPLGEKAESKQPAFKENIAAITPNPAQNRLGLTYCPLEEVKARVPHPAKPLFATQMPGSVVTQSSPATIRPHPPRHDSAVGPAPIRALPLVPNIDTPPSPRIPHGQIPQFNVQLHPPRKDSAYGARSLGSESSISGSTRHLPRHMPPQHPRAQLPPQPRSLLPIAPSRPPQNSGARSSTDSTQESILDYYCDIVSPLSAATDKSAKRLPQQPTGHPRSNDSSKALPNQDARAPRPPSTRPVLRLPEDPSAIPPVPISKYSPIAAITAAKFSPSVPAKLPSDHQPIHHPIRLDKPTPLPISSVGESRTFYSDSNASSPGLMVPNFKSSAAISTISLSNSTLFPSPPSLPHITRSTSAPPIDITSAFSPLQPPSRGAAKIPSSSSSSSLPLPPQQQAKIQRPTLKTTTSTTAISPSIRLHPSRGEKIVEFRAAGSLPRIIVPDIARHGSEGAGAARNGVANAGLSRAVCGEGTRAEVEHAAAQYRYGANTYRHRPEKSVSLVIESA